MSINVSAKLTEFPDCAVHLNTARLVPAFRFAAINTHLLRHLAVIGNYQPQRCGIATFTTDTCDALANLDRQLQLDVYAIDDESVREYGSPVIERIRRGDRHAYKAAGRKISASGAQIAWLQHEYGIFGGDDGNYALDLIDQIAIPLCVTLHTVLEDPSANQRHIIVELSRKSDLLIVMAEYGRDLLQREYGVDPEKILVVPHGIPDVRYIKPHIAKARFGLTTREIVLTFGLLSHDKGVGYMIDALPLIVERIPTALYIILGATHPQLIAQEGESLRNHLKAKIAANGMADHVLWIDDFVELNELTRYLQAADVYVTPYLNPMQVTSGTLAYATGLGKPVVSTPYVHAKELLPDSGGVLVPFRDSAALSAAVTSLLSDHDARNSSARQAYDHGRHMIWSCYAETIVSHFQKLLAHQLPDDERPLPSFVA